MLDYHVHSEFSVDCKVPMVESCRAAVAVGVTEIALVRVTKGGLEPIGVADLTLRALLRAQGWFAVPPEEEGSPAGEPTRAHPMPGGPHPWSPEDP